MNDYIEKEDDDDEEFYTVEPSISYQSSSINCGVSTIFSSRERKPFKKLSMLITPNSSHNSSFSLCNTIMLPYITTASSIYSDDNNKDINNLSKTNIKNNNTNSNNINNNLSNTNIKRNNTNYNNINNNNEIKNKNNTSNKDYELFRSETINENGRKHINLIKNKTTHNIPSLKDKIKEKNEKKENKSNEELTQVKDNNYSLIQNPFLLGKNLSYNSNINKIDINININKIKKINLNNVTYNNINNKSEKRNTINQNYKKIENLDLNDENKNEGSFNYIKRKKSEKIGENSISDKTEITLRKSKKEKIKNCLLNLKSKLKAHNNRRSLPNLEKSKSTINETGNKKNKKDKMEIEIKNKTSKNCNNYFSHNKNSDKISNIENNKKIMKKNTKEIDKKISIENEEEEEDEFGDEDLIKSKKKEKIKNNNKHEEIKKLFKKSKTKYYGGQIKINKSFHIKRQLHSIKEHLKNKTKEKNSSVSDNDSCSIDKQKKVLNRTLNLLEKGMHKKENHKKHFGKKSTFNLDYKKIEETSINKKRNTDRQKTFNSETLKKIKALKKEEIEKNQKQKSTKDKEKLKDKFDNSNKLISKIKISTSSRNLNIYKEKKRNSKKNNSHIILRKQRSNSLILENNKMKILDKKTGEDASVNNSIKENKNKKKLIKKVSDFENELQNDGNKNKMQFNLFSQDKFTNTEFSDSDYLKYTLNCMDLILDIDTEKQNRLKNKINFNFPLKKKRNIKKKIALFDLDETLVHCTGDIRTTKEKYQNIIEIKLPGRLENIRVGINCRPYWKQTLNLIKKYYHIVIYTASHQAYADAVLDFMDPKKKYFKYRLYRNNCSLLDVEGAKFYVKDLEIFSQNYNLKDIVIIDNSVLSFAFHLHNGIPIVPYYDEDKDGSLYVVGLYLMHIYNEDDLREANKKHINLDSFLEEAKRKKEEDIEEYEDEDNDSTNSLENIEENINEKEKEKENNINKEDEKENENNINNNNENKNKSSLLSEKKNDINSFVALKRTSLKNNSRKSEKKVLFKIQKKKSISDISSIFQRKKSQDFTKNKLRSQSRLLTMYYELNDESPKSKEKFNLRKSNIFKDNKLKEKILNGEINNNINNEDKNEEKKEDKNPTIIFIDNENENENGNENENRNENEIDCKSDHFYDFKEQKSLEEDRTKDEAKFKRGLTIKQDIFQDFKFDKNKNNDFQRKSIKNQLGFIRSNFYNTFKI